MFLKIGIVGSGNVGAAAAFAIMLRGGASEIVLVDRNRALAAAQAEDILHGTPFAHPVRVTAGDYADLAGASVVVLAAGVNQHPGETRLALLERNAAVFMDIVPAVLRFSDPIFLIATNPVDVMTWVTAKLSGKPKRVIGSGTILDTARFRTLLGAHLGVSAHSIHAYVLGEHGDSEVLCWSGAFAGGIAVTTAADQLQQPIDSVVRERIEHDVRYGAYKIIEGKGATWFGVGAGLARIVEAIGSDERALLTLSACEATPDGPLAPAFSLPRLVGRDGILSTLEPSLDAKEEEALRRSISLLRDVVAQFKNL
jgi:L-lactate dehydrogenase